jgi:hypothetical protein
MSKEDLIRRLEQLNNESKGVLSTVINGEYKNVTEA